jgi:hypothetical protein
MPEANEGVAGLLAVTAVSDPTRSFEAALQTADIVNAVKTPDLCKGGKPVEPGGFVQNRAGETAGCVGYRSSEKWSRSSSQGDAMIA